MQILWKTYSSKEYFPYLKLVDMKMDSTSKSKNNNNEIRKLFFIANNFGNFTKDFQYWHLLLDSEWPHDNSHELWSQSHWKNTRDWPIGKWLTWSAFPTVSLMDTDKLFSRPLQNRMTQSHLGLLLHHNS